MTQPVDPGAAKRVQGATSSRVIESLEALGLSPRQQALNDLWAWYRCQHYDARKVDWEGKEHVQGIDHHAISRAGFIPPGYYDAGNTLPLKFRRPTSPYALAKVVVDRFTGLLFSERRHPQLRVPEDPEGEKFVADLADAGRLWHAMIQARTFGGAMGTVAVGFQFLNGRPVFEVHDPRWTTPDFEDRFTLKLRSIEKRYQYPVEEKDPESGQWIEVPTWYRRTIDDQRDVLYKPVPVDENGDEPDWQVDKEAVHGLGFCPVVWMQNLPVQDDVDGDPDCHGIYDLIEAIDALLAQANRGILKTCDPTLQIVTDAEMAGVRADSSNALKLPAGSSAGYMEITGSGPKAATEFVRELRTYALEVAQCVLDHPDFAQRTATEIERVYSSMMAKADVLREQYGQKGVLPLMMMALQATQKVTTPRQEGDSIVRGKVVQLRGEPPKDVAALAVELQWGPYFEPSMVDVQAMSTAASQAKDSGLIDREHASKFVAPAFRVEDVPKMLASIKSEKEEEEQRANDAIMQGLGGGGGMASGGGDF